MLNAVIIDFETRSKCDLRKRGAYNYARDPSTDLLCMAAYDLRDDRKWLWFPHDGPLPDDLVAAIHSADFVAAHNAEFDWLQWDYVAVPDYDFPPLPADKWYCTAAQCRVNALPSALDKAALLAIGKRLKMSEGKALIRKLSIPMDNGKFLNDPKLLKQMGAYCLQDVVATAAVVRATRIMTQQEWQDWHVAQRINERGIQVDTELADLCARYSEAEALDMSARLAYLTNSEVQAVTQIARVKKWVLPRLPAHVVTTYMRREKTDIKTKETSIKIVFDKSARAAMLAAHESREIELAADVLDVLQTVQDGNKSSVAKFQKMLTLADDDDNRIRGAYLYAGAVQTKRFAARGLQVHNFRRDSIHPDKVDEYKQLLKADELDSDVMDTLSKLLRGAVIPKRWHKFIISDWSAIEGRVLPWLADSPGGEDVLSVFRRGEDIYVYTAQAMGLTDRQIGKVATLALGFAGGVGAFLAMGRIYGVHMPEHAAQDIVNRWRDANQWAVRFWKQLEKAIFLAMGSPGQWFPAGRVSYRFVPDLLGGTLLCLLPCGNLIQYPQAKVENVRTPWGKTRRGVTYAKAGVQPAAGETKWPRASLHAGLACENITQAVAASLLRHALAECEKKGLTVVLHTHDEIGIECFHRVTDKQADTLQKIMETPPKWAAGLPLVAKPDIQSRYGKLD